MVRIHPDPPSFSEQLMRPRGAIAQLGERLLCKQEVTGSIPVGSTSAGARRCDSRRISDECDHSSVLLREVSIRLFFNNLRMKVSLG